MFDFNNDKRNYDILWDQIGLFPSIQLKIGIKRKIFPLTKQYTKKRDNFYYVNNFVELRGKWDNSPGFGSLLSLKLKNISDSSIRITRLVFPTENGLDNFLKGFNTESISFLRNGYQSWSTSRSYKLKDKPLRPWLQLVSLASSNMANLPSNTPGILSSEMFSVISDLNTGKAFLVGQCNPFNQFFYIRLRLFTRGAKQSYFELVYDFGRKMLMPGETIQLDGIVMALEETSSLLSKYFTYINKQMNIKTLSENIKGWCTWYCYYNKINPELILKNVNFIKEKQLGFNLIQVDDGYQKHVGDWLDLLPSFDGKMKYLANKIQENGFMPGIWIAPFIADRKSELAKIHPEYVLRNEYGIPIKAGYNPWWHGKYYYGLDITNPRFEEYIRKIIRVITHDWGFKYLKLDFMFSACLRGGNHHELKMSRAEVLKYGIKVIREEAGKDVILVGCGMPLSTGIGTVDIMRVGPDTAAYWNRLSGFFLQTQAMIGARNSIRNSLVRSPMNKCLWINDPDCIMVRDKKTKLNPHQRLTLITTTVITGGLLIYSDDLIELSAKKLGDITKINLINEQCFRGRIFPLDLMEKEMPEFIYNSAGFIAVFNFKNFTLTKKIDLNVYPVFPKNIKKIKDAWTDEEFYGFNNYEIVIKNMQAYSSRLFKIFTE